MAFQYLCPYSNQAFGPLLCRPGPQVQPRPSEQVLPNCLLQSEQICQPTAFQNAGFFTEPHLPLCEATEAVVALAGLGTARRVLFPDNSRGKFGLCYFPGLLGNVCLSVWQLCPMAEAKNRLNKQPAAYTEQSGRTTSRLGSILPGCSLPGVTFCLFHIRWRALVEPATYPSLAEPATHPSLAEPAAHPPVKSQKKVTDHKALGQNVLALSG